MLLCHHEKRNSLAAQGRNESDFTFGHLLISKLLASDSAPWSTLWPPPPRVIQGEDKHQSVCVCVNAWKITQRHLTSAAPTRLCVLSLKSVSVFHSFTPSSSPGRWLVCFSGTIRVCVCDCVSVCVSVYINNTLWQWVQIKHPLPLSFLSSNLPFYHGKYLDSCCLSLPCVKKSLPVKE